MKKLADPQDAKDARDRNITASDPKAELGVLLRRLDEDYFQPTTPGFPSLDELSHVASLVVQQRKNKLVAKLREFFGENILSDIARVPGWRNNLMAVRERHAAVH